MAQQVISSLQNHINSEKQKLSDLERQNIRLEVEFHSQHRELTTAGDRALTNMANPGAEILRLLHQALDLKSTFTQNKSNLDREIANVKHNIETKQQQLQHLQNVMNH